MQYKVTWTIDIDAENPREAAEQALEIMQDKGSEALNFDVCNPDTGKVIENVDLFEEQEVLTVCCNAPIKTCINADQIGKGLSEVPYCSLCYDEYPDTE